MILPIYLYGERILREEGTDIESKSEELDTLIDNMFETLKHAEGVGLAAHQVGKAYNLFIVNFPSQDPNNDEYKEVFINPEIIEYSEEEDYFREGCLSVPDIFQEIKRPIKIKVKYLDRDLVEHIKDYDEFLAVVFQHEFDHTKGVYFVDKLHPLKKRMVSKKLQKVLKKNVDVPYKFK